MPTTAASRTSGPVRGYRDLIVWQDSMDLVLSIYRITAAFPKEERYSLVSQLRRAAVSVPSNIAEGHGRSRTGDYLRHLSVAVGSLSEVETQVQIARRLEYITEDDQSRLLESCNAIAKMFGGLIRSLRRRLHFGAGTQKISPDS
ncbi:MAG TPA: four helix bundle protein [Gemmatimonadales bacterium]